MFGADELNWIWETCRAVKYELGEYERFLQ